MKIYEGKNESRIFWTPEGLKAQFRTLERKEKNIPYKSFQMSIDRLMRVWPVWTMNGGQLPWQSGKWLFDWRKYIIDGHERIERFMEIRSGLALIKFRFCSTCMRWEIKTSLGVKTYSHDELDGIVNSLKEDLCVI